MLISYFTINFHIVLFKNYFTKIEFTKALIIFKFKFKNLIKIKYKKRTSQINEVSLKNL